MAAVNLLTMTYVPVMRHEYCRKILMSRLDGLRMMLFELSDGITIRPKYRTL